MLLKFLPFINIDFSSIALYALLVHKLHTSRLVNISDFPLYLLGEPS